MTWPSIWALWYAPPPSPLLHLHLFLLLHFLLFPTLFPLLSPPPNPPSLPTPSYLSTLPRTTTATKTPSVPWSTSLLQLALSLWWTSEASSPTSIYGPKDLPTHPYDQHDQLTPIPNPCQPVGTEWVEDSILYRCQSPLTTTAAAHSVVLWQGSHSFYPKTNREKRK